MPYFDIGDYKGDAVDRRGFLSCMAWAGTGLIWTVSGGILASRTVGQARDRKPAETFSFVQISDSHIGFGKDPYKETVTATLQQAVARINALPHRQHGQLRRTDQPGCANPVAGRPGSRDLLRPRSEFCLNIR
jgi:3',5'-cyclic-AMP phosphodiesterase